MAVICKCTLCFGIALIVYDANQTVTHRVTPEHRIIKFVVASCEAKTQTHISHYIVGLAVQTIDKHKGIYGRYTDINANGKDINNHSKIHEHLNKARHTHEK